MTEGPRDMPRIDERGIRPPRAYAIGEPVATEGVVVLALRGELDLAAAPVLRARFDAVRTTGARAVVLDLSEVTFMDSSAARELLRGDEALDAAGAGLVLAATRPAVSRLLELTRAIDSLCVAETVQQALERVTRPPGPRADRPAPAHGNGATAA